jgi:hypothetical protein
MPIGRIISAKHFVVSVSLVPLAAVRRTSVTVGTFVGLANVACCLQWTYPVTREEYEELASKLETVWNCADTDELLGQNRPDALDQAAAEVTLDAFDRRRRHGFH